MESTLPSRTPLWLTVLATVTGNAFLVLGSAILAVVTIAVSWIPPRGSWSFGVIRIWSNALLAASFVRSREGAMSFSATTRASSTSPCS
jgi:hypothetical protein